jgi:hypothetical protein
MTIIKRTNDDDTKDTDIYPLPGRYIRVLWVVFRGITANAGIIPEQTQVQWKNNGKSSVYVLDTTRRRCGNEGACDGNHAHEYPYTATGGKWRYMCGACG